MAFPRNVTMDPKQETTGNSSAAPPGRSPKAPAGPATFGDVMGSDIVTLVVGSEKYVFSVHRKFLCGKIKYFERMFMGGFKESTTNTANFPDDDQKSFGLLLQWVYDGTIPPILYYREGNKCRENWHPFRLYQLADKFAISELMDRTLDAIIVSMEKYSLDFSVKQIGEGYKRTPPGSPLRAFCCAMFVRELINAPDNPGQIGNVQAQKLIVDHPEIAQDMIPLLRLSSTGVPTYTVMLTYIPNCKFHTHVATFGVCPWKAKKSKEEQDETPAQVK